MLWPKIGPQGVIFGRKLAESTQKAPENLNIRPETKNDYNNIKIEAKTAKNKNWKTCLANAQTNVQVSP